eukprot:gene3404-34768_t
MRACVSLLGALPSAAAQEPHYDNFGIVQIGRDGVVWPGVGGTLWGDRINGTSGWYADVNCYVNCSFGATCPRHPFLATSPQYIRVQGCRLRTHRFFVRSNTNGGGFRLGPAVAADEVQEVDVEWAKQLAFWSDVSVTICSSVLFYLIVHLLPRIGLSTVVVVAPLAVFHVYERWTSIVRVGTFADYCIHVAAMHLLYGQCSMTLFTELKRHTPLVYARLRAWYQREMQRRRLRSQIASLPPTDSDDECAICKDAMGVTQGKVRLLCQHGPFHPSCIERALRNADICPFCRRPNPAARAVRRARS